MKIGNFWIIHNLHRRPRRYQAIEFDPKRIEECTNQLNKLLDEGYLIHETHLTEAGLVHEMVKP